MAKKLLKQSVVWIAVLAVMLAAVFIVLPQIAGADEQTVGAFKVTGGSGHYSYDEADHVLTIYNGGEVIIENADKNTATTDTIYVAPGTQETKITLNGVNIDVSGEEDKCAFEIVNGRRGDVTITLSENSQNTLKSGKNCAGLQKNNDTGTPGTLTINGSGSLEATGGEGGAGIGGASGQITANIAIAGNSIVTAQGGAGGAGIGCGYLGDAEYCTGIVINDSCSVKAAGGSILVENETFPVPAIGALIGTDGANMAVTPKDGTGADAKRVYLYIIPNESGESVSVDGNIYPTKHADGDTNVYAYLTYGDIHTVKVGDAEKRMAYNPKKNAFEEVGSDLTVTATEEGTTLKYGTDYTYPKDAGVLTILYGTKMTISGSGSTTKDRVIVNLGVDANITLDSVSIDLSDDALACAFKIVDNSAGNVTITLKNANVLKSGSNCAGLQKNGAYSERLGTLTIKGDGSLEATGGSLAAGIGSCYVDTNNRSSAKIIIEGSAKVTATGGENGAGIGGGCIDTGSHITIRENAVVTATGNGGGAGIGGGCSGGCSDIVIDSGAFVKATGSESNGYSAPAIGGGSTDSSNGTPAEVKNVSGDNVYLIRIDNFENETITIGNDESITADVTLTQGVHDAEEGTVYAYITGGSSVPKKYVKLGSDASEPYCFDASAREYVKVGTDFEVTGGTYGTDYSYPYVDGGSTLTILTNTAMIISGNTSKDGIVVKKDVSANITLDGVNIDVSSGTIGCAFKIEDDSTGNVNITLKGTNKLNSGRNCAGLQKNGTSGTLTIKGDGSLEATGGFNGAGIGGGNGKSAAGITITGSVVVTAAGNYGGAGIGGGFKGGSCSGIVIGADASVKAKGSTNAYKYSAPAIGGGSTDSSNGTPAEIKNESGASVYLIRIKNPDGEEIYVDSAKLAQKAHGTEKTVYAYVTGGSNIPTKTVKLGNNAETTYNFDALAREYVKMGAELVVTGGTYGTDYSYPENTNVLTILTDKAMTIANTDKTNPAKTEIVVKKDISANITLDGVYIDVSGAGNACAFMIEDDSKGNVTITLAADSENTLISGGYCAGLQKNGAYQGENTGKLTINGSGKLTAKGVGNGADGAGGAGIGGAYQYPGSHITISGNAVVTAIGGKNGAGIGGAEQKEGSHITIEGSAKVTATGGENGAGIGGGFDAAGSDITISDSAIVTANGSNGGAGIGGGSSKTNGASNIKITGGSVKAVGGAITSGEVEYKAADIGAGAANGTNGTPVAPKNAGGKEVYLLKLENTSNAAVTIDGNEYALKNHSALDSTDAYLYAYLTGGDIHEVKVGSETKYVAYNPTTGAFEEVGKDLTVTATAAGAALKYGEDYTYPYMEEIGGVLTILSDTKMTISGETTKDAIVVAKDKDANITLDGVNINVSNETDACAFKIEDNSTGNVTITLAANSENTLISGMNCAGLQKNGEYSTTLGKLTINGSGKLTATGGNLGAGIGGGRTNVGSNITISGNAVVIATGGNKGAGIGGGHKRAGSNITISGNAVVTATGGNLGAGIGGGSEGTGSYITISESATVTAKGNGGSAGIGGGLIGSASDIKITGGSVKAEGSSYIDGENTFKAYDIGSGVKSENSSYTDGTPEIPKNADGKEVYLLKLENASDAAVTIDGSTYPTKHADNDANVYAYLTGGDVHEVKVGSETKRVAYNPTTGAFEEVGKDLTVTATEAGAALKYGEDYTYPYIEGIGGVLTIRSDTAMTIKNAEGVTTTKDTIVVAAGKNADITLAGVDIRSSGCAFKIEDNSTGNVTITLADGTTNRLESGFHSAGLQKNGAYISDAQGKLTIKGSGKLTATGGNYGAGIGGGGEGVASNITISGSAVVTATGGNQGAGIGGGYNGTGSHITIGDSAVVTATGGNQGAGIGGGYNGTGSHITIGDSAVVTATGGNQGAGIGGGFSGSASAIKITGGSVKAIGSFYTQGADTFTAPAIGGGISSTPLGTYSNGATETPKNANGDKVYLLTIANPNGENVYIGSSAAAYTPKNHSAADSADTNLYVYLTGTDHPVKLGENGRVMNYDFNTTSHTFDLLGGDLVITATVTDDDPDPADPVNGTDYTYLNGVLTILSDKAMTIANAADVSTTTDTIFVEANVNANLTLAGVNIDVSQKADTAAFKIADGSEGNVTITITEGMNELKSGENCAGLEKNGEFISEYKGKLTIIMSGTGGPTVRGGENGAGIGGGNGKTGSNIIITATTQYGEVFAYGGISGAGIGGGFNGAGTNITISGGSVTATSGGDSAGIGGGKNGVGSDITITSGEVNTTGYSGAGIGGGYGTGGISSNITISGGVVTAEGRFGGAGIGGGFDNTANGIVISGGSVRAVGSTSNGGYTAPPIGNGASSSGNGSTKTPKNAAGAEVYLLTIANPDGAEVYIDGSATAYTPKNHSADTNLYVYLTGERHTVRVGSGEEETYIFNPLTNTFKKPDLTITATDDGESLTYGTDYEYDGTTLVIGTTKAVTISGTTTTETIRVDSAPANITLNGVDIDVSRSTLACALKIGDSTTGDVTITLADGTTNKLTSGNQCAGLHMNDSNNVTLTINGSGTLITTGGAGINCRLGTLKIGGSAAVTAIGKDGSAGIGGGALGSCGTVTIESGASVKAEGSTYGDYRAPAIGSGVQNNANGTPVTPKNSAGESVYLLKIETDGTSDVYVDDIKLPHKTHNGENAVYAYVTGDTHTVKLGADDEGVEYKLCGTGADAKFKVVPKAEDFTFSAPANLTYNGSAIEATVTTNVAEIGAITVKYYDESGDELSGAPVVPGEYIVKINIAEGDTYANAEDITAESWKFTIIKATPDRPDETSFTLDFTTDSDNMYTATVNTDLSGVEYSFDGTTWSDTNSKTGIGHNTEVTAYIRFKVSDVSNGSDSASKTKTTAHGNVTSGWSKDATEHWHACATCPNDKLDLEQHTSSGAATVGKAETCTICGYEISPAIVATPVIDPNGGAFTGSQTVTITCATDGATIYYTTNGAEPTAKSNVYSAAITLDETAMVKAIAVKTGMTNSEAATATFTKLEKAATPIITPNGGDFKGTQEVTITCATEGATIYYTTDGATPTTASTAYTGAFSITDTKTIKAIAVKDGMADSEAATATFTKLEKAATPVITPNGGDFKGTQEVTITCATDGATIYYTTDGNDPTAESTAYTGAFSITDTTTIKAIAVKDDKSDSEVATATFTKKSSSGGSGSSGGSTGGHSGGNSSNYPTNTTPTINGTSKTWSAIATELENAAANNEATISLNGNYEVPVEVIKAIADKNLKVTFVIDSWRSWTIDGADIEKPAAADFSAIQLPSSAIDGSAQRGTVGARLRIDGTNNPTALTVSFNKKYAGQFANLYRKDGDKLVFVDTVKIDENGNAQLEISEGGDYIFMLCEYSDRPGDMNNDGKLTAADATATLKYIVGFDGTTNLLMADLDGNGKINARDAVIVLKKVVGLA